MILFNITSPRTYIWLKYNVTTSFKQFKAVKSVAVLISACKEHMFIEGGGAYAK